MTHPRHASELTLLTYPERMELLESLMSAVDAISKTVERITTNDRSMTLLTLQSDLAAMAHGFNHLRDGVIGARVREGLTDANSN